MLDANLTQQLKTYLANLREPVELVASLGEDEKSRQTRELLAWEPRVSLADGFDRLGRSFERDSTA